MSYDNLLQKALELHQQGNLDEAEVIYREILETAPKNATVMHFLAMIAVTKGAYETAISILYKAIELDKKSAAPYFNLAMALQGAGYLGEALENYQKAIKLDKDFAPEGYNNMANIYRTQHDLKKAEHFYLKSIESNPEKSFFAYNGLGLLQREQGKNEDALESFQAAIDIEPSSGDAYANMATTLRSMGRVFEAIPLYEKALSIDSLNPVTLTGYGMALELDGKESQAMEAYAKVISSCPDFADAYARKGAIEIGRKDFKAAESSLRKATELNPEHFEAWLNLGVVLYNEKLYLEAMEAYRKAIILNPKSPEVCNNLAIAVHAAGDLEEAAGLCFNAIALDKDFPQVHNTLSVILTDMYKINKDLALGAAQAWLHHCPDNEIAKHTLASLSNDSHAEKASEGYIEQHFDDFATTFDETLLLLDYRVPSLIRDLLNEKGLRDLKVLDLGCGTGLCGKEVKSFSKHLIGADISSAMLEKAKLTGAYDKLVHKEAEAFLKETTERFDLVIAGDVLCYFGRLDRVFKGVYDILHPDGFFIFTLERSLPKNTVQGIEKKDISSNSIQIGSNHPVTSEEKTSPDTSERLGDETVDLVGKVESGSHTGDYVLNESGRFAHSAEYVKEQLESLNFRDVEIEFTELRKEQGKPIEGMLVCCKKVSC